MYQNRNFNLSNQQRTYLEQKKRDVKNNAKRDDFPFINLSKDELHFLKSLQKHPIHITNANNLLAKNLIHLNFAETLEDADTEVLTINDRGIRYLMYVKSTKAQSTVEWVRYIITTIIAVMALILAGVSLAAQLGLIKLPSA